MRERKGFLAIRIIRKGIQIMGKGVLVIEIMRREGVLAIQVIGGKGSLQYL